MRKPKIDGEFVVTCAVASVFIIIIFNFLLLIWIVAYHIIDTIFGGS